MFKGLKIGVVVPAYNEERFIARVVANIPDFVDRIYVVDDASNDHTLQIASHIPGMDGRLNVVSHETNKGVGAAIATGYRKCLADKIDIAAVMAGDDQMDPAELPKLLTPIVEGKADYTKGNRLLNRQFRQGMSAWRSFGNFLLTWLTRIAAGNFRLSDPQNGYCAISKQALAGIDLDGFYPGYGYCNNLLVKLAAGGARIIDVPIPARYGTEKSKIRYTKYIPRVSWLLLKDFLWRMRKNPFGRRRLN